MRPEGAKHEAIRLLYHLWGDWPAEIAAEFGLQADYVRGIIRYKGSGLYKSAMRLRPIPREARASVPCEDVFAYIAQNGPVSRQDIQLAHDASKSSILRRLGTLQEQGKITREGRKWRALQPNIG